MSARHDHLVDALSALLTKLEAGDAELAAASMEAITTALTTTPNVVDDERVLPLFNRCVTAATTRRDEFDRELRAHASSARANAAYGGSR